MVNHHEYCHFLHLSHLLNDQGLLTNNASQPLRSVHLLTPSAVSSHFSRIAEGPLCLAQQPTCIFQSHGITYRPARFNPPLHALSHISPCDLLSLKTIPSSLHRRRKPNLSSLGEVSETPHALWSMLSLVSLWCFSPFVSGLHDLCLSPLLRSFMCSHSVSTRTQAP